MRQRAAVGAVGRSSPRRRRRRRRCARRAGSRCRSARPDSRCRPSARGVERTSRATGRSAAAALRIRSPRIVCWRMNSHSSLSSGPGLSRIASGMPTLPTSCSSAARATSSISSPLIPKRRATAIASCATSLECAPSDGCLACIVRMSTSRACSPAPEDRPCLCAYMRSSASWSACSRLSASCGSRTTP